MRRPPTGGLPLLRHRLRLGWQQLLDTPWPWVLLFALVGAWALLPHRLVLSPSIQAGGIAHRTWIADRDLVVVDAEATLRLQESARQDVLPVYDLDRSVEAERRAQLGALFTVGRQLLESEEFASRGANRDAESLERFATRLAAEASTQLPPDTLRWLIERGFSTQLEDRLGSNLSRVLRVGVVANKEVLLEHRVRGITLRELPSGRESKVLDLYRFLDYPDEVGEEINKDMLAWSDLRANERQLLVALLQQNVTPNLNFNGNATQQLKRQAGESVGSVTHPFAKGEVIARKGARIDQLQAEAMGQLAGTRDVGALGQSILGTLLLLGAVALLLWRMAEHEGRRDRTPARLLSECLILLTLHMAGANFASFIATALAGAIGREPFADVASYTFAIPFASLALIALLLYGRNVALVLSLVFSLLAGRLVGADAMWETTVFALTSCLAAVFALDQAQFRQRSLMTRAAIIVVGVNVATVTVLQLMGNRLDQGPGKLVFDLLCAAGGGLLAAALASFAVPIIESLFSLTTSIKLIELANPNLPLLRRLALEAPGTFQHSLAVANLAKAGVEAIDGDSVLVHTGALYHDIGKMFRPQYFIENQPHGRNPHDKIQPSMSALILVNHVKEGLELAQKHSLPLPIHEAIEQHHGTRLIKFFYNRARDQTAPDTTEVREADFRYPGRKPQSKEMGVMMLADGVEAASRTLVEPGRQKIRAVLRAIFDDCLKDGQLDETDLTLSDLQKVEAAFERVLINIYHRRIDYPGFDFNRQGGRDGATSDEGNRADGNGKNAKSGKRKSAKASKSAQNKSGDGARAAVDANGAEKAGGTSERQAESAPAGSGNEDSGISSAIIDASTTDGLAVAAGAARAAVAKKDQRSDDVA